MTDPFTELEFHYATVNLSPYARDDRNSCRLLKDVVHNLNSQELPNELRLIDRHKGRKNTPKRELVHISAPFTKGGMRCYGRMALIKNKTPKLWEGKDVVKEIVSGKGQQFIEITNYVIDFNSEPPVVMIEFNSAGPRLSDFIFFFRQICSHYRIATAIKGTYHLSTDYNDLDNEITNIFSVVVKANPNKFTGVKGWFKSFRNLRDETGYKDVRMEFFYQRQKDTRGNYIKNIKGLSYAREIIGWLKSDDNNIEKVEDLKMSYQTNNSDEVLDLDFLKNKTTSLVQIPVYNSKNQFKIGDFHHYGGQEFTHYLKTGLTHEESKIPKE